MKPIKATLRIPTDMYAYIEVEIEGTPLEVKEKYDELTSVMTNKENSSDFYSFLQTIIDSDLTIWGSVDDYNALTPKQQAVMQSLKRFKKRNNEFEPETKYNLSEEYQKHHQK